MSGPVIFERAKPGGETVVAKLAEYNGSRFLDIREWVSVDGERTATRKGVTVPLEAMQALGAALIAAKPSNGADGLSDGS